jgi:hypothetical protein
MVDWVIDPQNGQSLPDWVDEVDWFAAGVDEGMKVLRGARALMYARNLVFAGREHTDRKGRTKKGMKGFTPTLEYPQINLTIDEAHAILQIPEAVTILAEMGKMGSKCGIKVRLVVHLPLLSELGGSSVLRDMVASGNVFVLRTASRITGQVAFQGALPVDPVTIPRRMPDGSASAGLGFALGADSRRAPMRLDWVEDPLDLIEGIPITHLSDDEARAAGGDYAQYRGLRFDEDIIDVEVIEDAPATRAEPQSPWWSAAPAGSPARTASSDRQGVRRTGRSTPSPRVARPNRPASSSDVEEQNITKTIKELCDDPNRRCGPTTTGPPSTTRRRRDRQRVFPHAQGPPVPHRQDRVPRRSPRLVAQSEWALAIAVGWPAWIAWAAPLALDAYVLAAISANRDLGPSVIVSAASVLGSHAVYAAPGAWEGGVVHARATTSCGSSPPPAPSSPCL